MLRISDRCSAAGGDYLRLKTVGTHPGREVLGDIKGNHLDASLSLRDRLFVGVTAANAITHVLWFVAEDGIEELVQRVRTLDGQVGETRLVKDGNGGAIRDRLRDRIRVDERTEAAHGAALETFVNWGTREAKERGLRQRLLHQRAQYPVLRPVSFVDHDKDV